MAKEKNWTKEELNLLKEYLDRHIPKEEIAKRLNRSFNGIRIAWYRKLKYKPLCFDCGIPITGNSKRCPHCAEKRNDEKKREYSKTTMKKWREHYRDLIRFGGNKEKVLERDKYSCQKCGKTNLEVMLDIHHIDKSGRNKKTHNNSMENLITYCHSCHTKIHKEDTIMKRWRKENVG